MLECLRDDFNGLIIGNVILVGVRVSREHRLYCEDNGGRTDKNLSPIERSGANGEGVVDNNEVRICKGGVVVVDATGSGRIAADA